MKFRLDINDVIGDSNFWHLSLPAVLINVNCADAHYASCNACRDDCQLHRIREEFLQRVIGVKDLSRVQFLDHVQQLSRLELTAVLRPFLYFLQADFCVRLQHVVTRPPSIIPAISWLGFQPRVFYVLARLLKMKMYPCDAVA